MLIVAEGEPQKGKTIARLKVSPKTGIIESDWLAAVIYQVEKSLEKMDENTKYHFLLMPCAYSREQIEEGTKKGWEYRWIKSEPAEELLLETDESQN